MPSCVQDKSLQGLAELGINQTFQLVIGWLQNKQKRNKDIFYSVRRMHLEGTFQQESVELIKRIAVFEKTV